jgi:hypothetical protein
MTTLLSFFDFIVLVVLVVHVTRTVRKEAVGSGSLVLSICIALVVVTFAIVSFSAFVGLATQSSTLTRIALFLVLIVISALIGFSWSDKPSRTE